MTRHLKTLIGNRVRCFQPQGFRYTGRVVAENDSFLTLHDERTRQVVLLAKNSLLTVVILGEDEP